MTATDMLHHRGQRNVELTAERELGDRTARTWQVTSTWTCAAVRHDTLGAVKNDGCTCPEALERRARYEKGRRTGQVVPLFDSVGVVRRLRALAAGGYSSQFVADRMGLDKANLWQLRSGRRSQVSARIRKAVCDLYDELSGTPGPSTVAARHALAKGWAAPLAWDDNIDDPAAAPDVPRQRVPMLYYDIDTVAVERVLGGERLPLNPAEQAEVARQLLERGQGVGRIGAVLHVNGKTARRLLERVTQKAG